MADNKDHPERAGAVSERTAREVVLQAYEMHKRLPRIRDQLHDELIVPLCKKLRQRTDKSPAPDDPPPSSGGDRG